MHNPDPLFPCCLIKSHHHLFCPRQLAYTVSSLMANVSSIGCCFLFCIAVFEGNKNVVLPKAVCPILPLIIKTVYLTQRSSLLCQSSFCFSVQACIHKPAIDLFQANMRGCVVSITQSGHQAGLAPQAKLEYTCYA